MSFILRWNPSVMKLAAGMRCSKADRELKGFVPVVDRRMGFEPQRKRPSTIRGKRVAVEWRFAQNVIGKHTR